MANDNRRPPIEGDNLNRPSPESYSLRDRDASEIRNEQRSGKPGAADPQANPSEANATMRQVWSEPGGEANNYRNATIAAGTKSDGHSDLVAAETPETHRHLSDASLSPREPERDAGTAAGKLGQDEGGNAKG